MTCRPVLMSTAEHRLLAVVVVVVVVTMTVRIVMRLRGAAHGERLPAVQSASRARMASITVR